MDLSLNIKLESGEKEKGYSGMLMSKKRNKGKVGLISK